MTTGRTPEMTTGRTPEMTTGGRSEMTTGRTPEMTTGRTPEMTTRRTTRRATRMTAKVAARKRWMVLTLPLVLVLLAISHERFGQGSANAQTGPPPSQILLAFSAGGVLTRDGTLWVYRPDRGLWMTIDESFRREGRETRVLPLPVPAAEILQMETFGFIVTRSGTCWVYDLEKDRWKEAGSPPARP